MELTLTKLISELSDWPMRKRGAILDLFLVHLVDMGRPMASASAITGSAASHYIIAKFLGAPAARKCKLVVDDEGELVPGNTYLEAPL